MFWEKLFRSNFIIKLRHWEYWPFGIVQFPAILYFLWLSFRARSFIFFSASNPGITMGGMFGESKYDILKKIPQQYVARSVRINRAATTKFVEQVLIDHAIKLPAIFKPDLGERGFMVKKVQNDPDIESYLSKVNVDFIAQELITWPIEFGVFYTRFPNDVKGKVTSVVMKKMLTVEGDGHLTLEELIQKNDRAKLQWQKLKVTYHDDLHSIVPAGKIIELVSIGNHCLGTTFLNANHLITEELSQTFDTISKQIEGFYFGRFDLRCKHINDLYTGNIKIMELNGCGAEPAHIYQPGYSLFKAMGVLLLHWQNIYTIAKQNHRRGVNYTTMKQAYFHYKTFKAALA
jgi:hypothetical protein